jgi:hypothetical protein
MIICEIQIYKSKINICKETLLDEAVLHDWVSSLSVLCRAWVVMRPCDLWALTKDAPVFYKRKLTLPR